MRTSWGAVLVLLGASWAGAAGTTGGESAAVTESPVRLEVTADREAITIGDPITLTIRLLAPPEAVIESFAPEAGIGDLALLGREIHPPAILEDGRRVDERLLRVTAYAVGGHEIPALSADYSLPGGGRGTARSRPIPFTVASVVPADDTRPADIRPPATMPLVPRWPWILAALLAAAAAAWWWWRRRRAVPEAAAPVPAGPPRPAHEVAYAGLERLLAGGLLEKGRIKEFYIALTEIVRRYVEARFGVETFERTTAEILEALLGARLPIRVTTGLAEFLSVCDLVKFAKFLPDAEATRVTVALAYRLVDETRPAEPPAVPGALAAGAGPAGAGQAAASDASAGSAAGAARGGR